MNNIEKFNYPLASIKLIIMLQLYTSYVSSLQKCQSKG